MTSTAPSDSPSLCVVAQLTASTALGGQAHDVAGSATGTLDIGALADLGITLVFDSAAAARRFADVAVRLAGDLTAMERRHEQPLTPGLLYLRRVCGHDQVGGAR